MFLHGVSCRVQPSVKSQHPPTETSSLPDGQPAHPGPALEALREGQELWGCGPDPGPAGRQGRVGRHAALPCCVGSHVHAIRSPGLSLDQRVEYLSRAVVSAKSCNLATSASTAGEFLHHLEEKMEVSLLL